MTLLFTDVSTRLPVEDLDRARAWYSATLGLDPVETREGGLRYRIGDGEFCLFTSTGQSPSAFTQMAIGVADLDSAVTELKNRGVVFEDYDDGPMPTVDAIATIAGNYPSKGTGDRAAWFTDCDGNLIGLSEATGSGSSA
jgi:catechol 2,3-dioxygenase-like lactoylglutathione lyase family enzyme